MNKKSTVGIAIYLSCDEDEKAKRKTILNERMDQKKKEHNFP